MRFVPDYFLFLRVPLRQFVARFGFENRSRILFECRKTLFLPFVDGRLNSGNHVRGFLFVLSIRAFQLFFVQQLSLRFPREQSFLGEILLVVVFVAFSVFRFKDVVDLKRVVAHVRRQRAFEPTRLWNLRHFDVDRFSELPFVTPNRTHHSIFPRRSIIFQRRRFRGVEEDFHRRATHRDVRNRKLQDALFFFVVFPRTERSRAFLSTILRSVVVVVEKPYRRECRVERFCFHFFQTLRRQSRRRFLRFRCFRDDSVLLLLLLGRRRLLFKTLFFVLVVVVLL